MDSPRRRLKGHPTDCTPKKIAEICGYVEVGNSFTDACILSGISRKTYYNWVERGETGEEPYADFLRATTEAQAKARAFFISVMHKSTSNKEYNYKPALAFLERRDRENWGAQVKVEQTATVDAAELLKELEKGNDHGT